MNDRMKKLSIWALATAGLGACATARPPPELVAAREAYQRAQSGPPAKFMPAELYSDKHYLDAAEAAFKAEQAPAETRDRSYLALRKIEATESHARTAQYAQQRAEAEAAAQSNMRSELSSTRKQLASSSQQLAASSQQNQASQSELAKTKEQLEQEKQARAAAELQLHDALAKIAKVKEDDRGTVITLSGSVLFGSGKSELLASAQNRLGPVADALKAQPKRNIVIQGHTDSRGKDSTNQELSVRRAESVQRYLTDHGVDAGRIRSEGKGPSQPVAENNSAEGRANNRRVEIILEREAGVAATPTEAPATKTTTSNTTP